MSTLPQRIAQAREKKGLNQSELARAIGVSPQAVQGWESGKASPRGNRLTELSKILGVSVQELLVGPGQPPGSQPCESETDPAKLTHPDMRPISMWDDSTPLDEDEIEVPFLKEVELSAGSGRFSVDSHSRAKLRFGKYTLMRLGVQPSNVICMPVKGNSMEPLLADGSTVAVDTGATTVVDGKMYGIFYEEMLRVKILYRLAGGKLRIRSFNRDEYEDEVADVSAVNIIGRVFQASTIFS
ncbi:XRE family transcriptional regulator [Pseudomonas alkylphenolica]|uniref:Phage transcriptional regulator n=1 Tax=Pseudomonas alkylphenolica TaxID=237609 RepID=A0A077F5X8_9PSED|nr:helix-turn-helix transcriptional regulator [Pseudomonas alkylphenolica]AIL60912.1 phage transcriptional regulator [Pseudomonas alkylphenolica]